LKRLEILFFISPTEKGVLFFKIIVDSESPVYSIYVMNLIVGSRMRSPHFGKYFTDGFSEAEGCGASKDR